MKQKKEILFSLLTIVLFAVGSLVSCKQKKEATAGKNTADIIIYGGTSAAVTAAVQAKNSGKSVIIVIPRHPFGRFDLRRFGLYGYGGQKRHRRASKGFLPSPMAALQFRRRLALAKEIGIWQQGPGHPGHGRRK